jgi:hypothetical protein
MPWGPQPTQVNAEHPDGAYTRPTVSGLGLEKSPVTSIPQAFYYVIVTTTTVGSVPITATATATVVTLVTRVSVEGHRD